MKEFDNIVTTVKARENFADLINQAAYGNKRIILTRRGKQVAALISINELKKIEEEDKNNG